MLDKGIIRHNTSPFSSLVVLVRKKDNIWRAVVVDCIPMNEMTIKDKFLIPLIEKMLDEL